jgi:hypothetical protein
MYILVTYVKFQSCFSGKLQVVLLNKALPVLAFRLLKRSKTDSDGTLISKIHFIGLNYLVG